MAPDQYQFGIEIEIIAKPHKVRSPLVPALYYSKLAASLKKRGLDAKADDLAGGYRKYTEEYSKRWYITRDGSLQRTTHPEIALEAVSRILSTSTGDWEGTIEKFWEAQKAVFHMPERTHQCGSHVHITPGRFGSWSLNQVKDLAVGILVYEDEVQHLLPSWRRTNGYCVQNSKNSTRLRAMELSSNKNTRCQQLRNQLSSIRNKTDLCAFMQKDRYVLWNFGNIKDHCSGTIEFRGGRGLRGPERTKRWISFVVAFIDFLLHEELYTSTRNPSTAGVENLYKKIREAAARHAMKQNLPRDYRVFNESARASDVESGNDVESDGSVVYDFEPTPVFAKDAEPPPYTLNPPPMARTRDTFTYHSVPEYTRHPSEPQDLQPTHSVSSDHQHSWSCRVPYFDRVLQILWIVLVLSLIGHIIASADAGNPSIINYSIFAAVFSLLSLMIFLVDLILVDLIENSSLSNSVLFIMDLLNTLFWFCGAVALAADLGIYSCHNQTFLKSNGITNGVKVDKYSRCVEAQAACAFLFFGFITSVVSSGFSCFKLYDYRSTHENRGPSMSQV